MNKASDLNGELGQYLSSVKVKKSIPLSRGEELELSRRIKMGDIEARNELVEANLRFVVSVAKGYQKQGLSLEDLVEAGNFGLITAANRFDGNKGYKFISYAIWWVRQAILKALAEEGRKIRLPLSQIAFLLNIQKTAARLENDNSNPTTEEIAAELGKKEEDVVDILLNSTNPRSLNAELKTGGENTLLDIIPDETQQTDALALQSIEEEDIEKALVGLEPREIDILKMYFGLGGREPMTLEKIGRVIGITRERVRQLKERAITKLRYSSRREILETLLPEHEPK